MLTKKLDNYEQTTHPEVSLELSFLARANVNNNRQSDCVHTTNMISDSDEDDVSVTEKYIKDNDTLKKYGWAGKLNKNIYNQNVNSALFNY